MDKTKTGITDVKLFLVMKNSEEVGVDIRS